MSAALTLAVEGGSPTGTGIVIAAVVILMVTLALALSARRRHHLSELLEYAAREDWHPVSDPAGLPAVVAEALLSKRSRLFRRFQRLPLWVSWHQWAETPGGAHNGAAGSATRDLTRYFAQLPGAFPDMTVERRRRPDPKGARPFERRFTVRPSDELSAQLPPRVVQALLAQTVPPFTVAGNVVIVRFEDRPTRENLSARADEVRRLTLLLSPRSRPEVDTSRDGGHRIG